ncbi:MAG: nuclear transport factor 2 family protein [Steroidobacteraceae bacterium]
MSLRRTGIILLAALLAGCASSPRIEETTQRIRALEQQQAQAAIARDRAALDRIFAPDFQIVNPSGVVASKEELLALLLGGTSPYRSAVYQTDTVRVYRDVVVSTGLETVVPNTGAQAGQQVRRRITQVWKREGGDWRLALRHATIVTP